MGGRGFRVYTRAFIGGDTNLGKLGNFEGALLTVKQDSLKAQGGKRQDLTLHHIDQFLQLLSNFTIEDHLLILGNPDKVVLDIIGNMGCFSNRHDSVLPLVT